MKKQKKIEKLQMSRETVRVLAAREIVAVAGGESSPVTLCLTGSPPCHVQQN
jgi:hypothetical protein